MKQLKFKLNPAPSNGSHLYVKVQLRKWYIIWIYITAFFKAINDTLKNK